MVARKGDKSTGGDGGDGLEREGREGGGQTRRRRGAKRTTTCRPGPGTAPASSAYGYWRSVPAQHCRRWKHGRRSAWLPGQSAGGRDSSPAGYSTPRPPALHGDLGPAVQPGTWPWRPSAGIEWRTTRPPRAAVISMASYSAYYWQCPGTGPRATPPPWERNPLDCSGCVGRARRARTGGAAALGRYGQLCRPVLACKYSVHSLAPGIQ